MKHGTPADDAGLPAYLVALSTVQIATICAPRLSRPVAAGILVLSCAAGSLVWRRLSTLEARASWRAALSDSRWGWPLAGAFVALYAFLVACAAIAADPSWDGNSYHLPAIHQWVQQGRVAWIEGIHDGSTLRFMNGYSKAGEVVSFFLVALIHPSFSNTLNLVYLPLGVLGTSSIARTLGASRGAALVAGAAFMLVPLNLGQSLTTYVDAAFGSAAVAWLAITLRSREIDRHAFWLQALILGCALGLMVGVKGTGLLLGAIGTCLLLTLHLARRSPALPARLVPVWWLGVGIVSLVVGGFWYARNLAHGHGPLYPIGMSVAGLVVYAGDDPYALSGAFAADGFIEHWPAPVQVAYTWLQGFSRWPRSIVGFDMRLGGLGFLWPLGCLPAVFLLARHRARARTPWRDEAQRQPLWLLLTIVSAGFVLLPHPWWSRFTIWVYALGLPCLAVVQPRARASRRGRVWLGACVAIALIEAGVVVANWQVRILERTANAGIQGAPMPPIPTHFYPPSTLRGTIIERIAQTHDTVGIGPLDWYQEVIVGVVSEPVGARQVHYLPEDPETHFAGWYDRVRPRYLIMDEQAVLPAYIARLEPEVHRVRSLWVVQFW